jgi:uncharacterized membrane protein
VVDHHLLGVHNVRDDVADPQLWNLGFLAGSVLLLVAGLALVASVRREERSPTRRELSDRSVA